MDVSADLAAHAARFSAQQSSNDSVMEVDPAILTAFDEAPTDDPEYTTDLEAYLLSRSTSTTQTLLNTLFSLPIIRTPLGPSASLPISFSHALLPREKPLPKPKPLTKWERFAKEKGISHKKKEKMIWDDEKQDWVARWGRDGKNKEKEDVWIREVKGGEDADHDPRSTARTERRERIAKNTRQAERNAAEALASSSVSTSTARPGVSTLSQSQKAQLRETRKKELDRSMALSRTATASMGKFDKRIEGEAKIKGVKRKFEPTSAPSFSSEKDSAMDILTKINKPKTGDADVNVRKALRFQERAERLSGARGGAGGGRGGTGRGGKR